MPFSLGGRGCVIVPDATVGASEPSDDAATPDKPQVRKIEGPATEPIDLMEVGGSSLVKRLLPAVIAIVVVLLLVRRRRG